MAATYLGLRSPGCEGRVGQEVAGKRKRAKRGQQQGDKHRVDVFGNVFSSVALGDDEGGNYRTRHDHFAADIEELIRWVGSGLSCTREVYGLFAHLITQDALDKVQEEEP